MPPNPHTVRYACRHEQTLVAIRSNVSSAPPNRSLHDLAPFLSVAIPSGALLLSEPDVPVIESDELCPTCRPRRLRLTFAEAEGWPPEPGEAETAGTTRRRHRVRGTAEQQIARAERRKRRERRETAAPPVVQVVVLQKSPQSKRFQLTPTSASDEQGLPDLVKEISHPVQTDVNVDATRRSKEVRGDSLSGKYHAPCNGEPVCRHDTGDRYEVNQLPYPVGPNEGARAMLLGRTTGGSLPCAGGGLHLDDCLENFPPDPYGCWGEYDDDPPTELLEPAVIRIQRKASTRTGREAAELLEAANRVVAQRSSGISRVLTVRNPDVEAVEVVLERCRCHGVGREAAERIVRDTSERFSVWRRLSCEEE